MSELVFKLSRVRGAPVSDKELINDLRLVAESLGTNRVTRDQYKQCGIHSVVTYEKRFGGWNKALLRSGLIINVPVSDEELIADLRRVAESLKTEYFTIDQYREYGKYGEATVRTRFGMWKQSLHLAGLVFSNKVNYSDVELCDNIRKLWKHYGRQPSIRELASAPSCISRRTYRNRFGSWMNTLRAFVDYINRPGTEKKQVFVLSRTIGTPVSNEELIENLRHVAKLLATNQIASIQYKQYGEYSLATLNAHFGAWNKALIRAGLAISNKVNYSDVELFDNILKVWQHYGRQPSVRELASAPSYILTSGPYRRRFGSWMNALKAFVDYANGTGVEATEDTIEETSETLIVKTDGNRIDETIEQNIEEIVVKRHITKRDPSLRLRWRVLQRDNFKCCRCGASPAITLGVELHVDHIDPWSKGGETVLKNLQTLCSKCNLGKSNLLPEIIDLQTSLTL